MAMLVENVWPGDVYNRYKNHSESKALARCIGNDNRTPLLLAVHCILKLQPSNKLFNKSSSYT